MTYYKNWHPFVSLNLRFWKTIHHKSRYRVGCLSTWYSSCNSTWKIIHRGTFPKRFGVLFNVRKLYLINYQLLACNPHERHFSIIMAKKLCVVYFETLDIILLIFFDNLTTVTSYDDFGKGNVYIYHSIIFKRGQMSRSISIFSN